MLFRRLLLIGLIALTTAASAPARGAGPSVVVMAHQQVDAATARRVERAVAARRALRSLRPMPAAATAPTEVAQRRRIEAVALALERARQHGSEAAWDACAREAAEALGDAVELLAHTLRLDLLRDLHVQIGVCMTLGQHAANAQPHFVAAALLDEAPPQDGRFREEAESALAAARADVLARSHGPVRITTTPTAAELWIDGRRAGGVAPLDAAVRLGDHFVTVRRFRFEPLTERRVLQPGSRVRFQLEPARRDTLRRQLAEVAAGKRKVNAAELRFARARWSRAAQLLWIAPVTPAGRTASGRPSKQARPGPLAPQPAALPRGALALSLIDVATGRTLRRQLLSDPTDDEVLGEAVCGVLGETCEPDEGIPWYVWPIAGVAVVGAAVAAGFIYDAARPTRFCPSSGCD